MCGITMAEDADRQIEDAWIGDNLRRGISASAIAPTRGREKTSLRAKPPPRASGLERGRYHRLSPNQRKARLVSGGGRPVVGEASHPILKPASFI